MVKIDRNMNTRQTRGLNTLSGSLYRKRVDQKIQGPKTPILSELESSKNDIVPRNKMSLKEGLINAVKQGKYILIGEDHSPCVESIRWEIKDTLKLLKKIGVTRMAFEIDYIHQPLLQTLDFNSLFILSDLKREISNRIPEGNYRMLVEAKKIGMQVLFIDDHSLFNSEADHYQRQQRRDDTMFKIIENTKDAGKTLIYIGSSHVYQNCTEKFTGSENNYITDMVIVSFPFDMFPLLMRHLCQTRKEYFLRILCPLLVRYL